MAKHYYKKNRLISVSYKKIIGGLLIGTGMLLILYFFLPLILWHVYFSAAFASSNLQVPIPRSLVVGKDFSMGSLLSSGVSSLTNNYEDAREWFPSYTFSSPLRATSYQLSIPKLGIDKANVSTSDYNLSAHLVQYAGTSLPGERGTAVILGHSTLPQFFDQKNYKTIFAKLHTLRAGDEFSITIDNATYKYRIFSISVVDATDESIFLQSYDNSYVALVTCTPPGTVWKRLIIRADIEDVVQ